MEDEPGLSSLMQVLEQAGEIAFDTEADSFYSYRERVCLIQVTVDAEDYLVDPLKGLDLSPIGDVLADGSKTKIFHDGEYDVLILKQDYGFSFAGLFDTRIAAAALGLELPGLASVVSDRFGIELDKSQQRSDWSRRPLSREQIAYARQDTRYLIPLMHELRDELEQRGRTDIVEGECRRLEGLEPNPRTFDPDEFLRLKGARALDPLRMQVLRELYIWRDAEAKRRNVPSFKVLGNAPLLSVARKLPRSERALEGVDGLYPKVARRLGKPLLEAVQRAQELGPLKRMPSLPPKDGTGRLDEVEVELFDRLKAWRKTHAEAQGIDASLVLNRHVLHRLATQRPADNAALRDTDGMLEWQFRSFGDELLELLQSFERELAAGRLKLRTRRRRSR